MVEIDARRGRGSARQAQHPGPPRRAAARARRTPGAGVPREQPHRFHPIGDGGVIVQLDIHHDDDFDGHDNAPVHAALQVEFGAIKPSAWKRQKGVVYEISAPQILFCAAEESVDREYYLKVALKPARYELDVAVVRFGIGDDGRTLELVRLRPAGTQLDMSARLAR